MPSLEDYLDKLLEELPEEDVGEAVPEVPQITEADELQGAGGGFWQDVTEEAEDGDVQEIHDMLNKYDRNEAIDGRRADSESERSGKGPADKLRADIAEAAETQAKAAVNGKETKVSEKQRLKEEKAAARKAKKESAKEQKESKRRQKKNKNGEPKQEKTLPERNDAETIAEYDLLADKDLLDSIVSEAGRLEREETSGQEDNPMDTVERTGRDTGVSDGEVQEASDKNKEDADIMALDMDEIDAYIPDITQNEEENPKKKGLMSKFVDFLMEEEEEPENEDIRMSEENQEILDELDREKANQPKKKKEKKKKEKKKKEPKPKKAKPPKPKKEKKPKEEEPYIPGKKLTFKKSLPVLLLGVTVGAVIFLFVNLSVDYTVRREAEAAYDAGDYQTCYLKLFGKKLNESEEMMYGKSQSILYIQLWYQEYMKIAQEGSEAEKLDNLIQIVNDYPKLNEYALQWNAAPEVYAVYSELLNILYERYGVTEEQAREIAAIKSDIAYTRVIIALAEGGGYGVGNITGENDSGMPLQNPEGEASGDTVPEEGLSGEQSDMLPEESEIDSGNFVDNGSGQL